MKYQCRLHSLGDVSKSLQSNVQRMQSAQGTAAQERTAFENKLQDAKQNMQVCVDPVFFA